MKRISNNNMPKLFLGLFFCSLCTVFAIHSNLGLSPWGVFHQGIARKMGISFGLTSIVISLMIVLIVSFLGLRVGIGTIYNMLFIGIMVDVLDYFHLIPDAASMGQGIMMLVLSMMFNAIGSYLYISCELGCGPRDGLMSVLTMRTHLPVGMIRCAIEGTVFLTGWSLGGTVGIGTVINVFGISVFIDLFYKMMDFQISKVHHHTIWESIRFMKG
ncbi:MAG: hypothetical protein PHQ72_05825 [Hespellia sp.]|nr:hypothetical protein [Hespellia sp.]